MNRSPIYLAMLLLALATPLWAQLQVGDTSMNLNGQLSLGYNAQYSNMVGSAHSVAGAGTADLAGSYFDPNFLSFHIQPFYNQSRANSSFQSVTSASGVSASANIFGGSSFPGSVTYARTYNGSGTFGIPGLADYTTHGNNENFAVNWGVNLENLPRLHFSFADGNNAYSVYGLDTQGTAHQRAFSAGATYNFAGFNLNGDYQHTNSQTATPQVFTGGATEEMNSGGNSLSLGVGHSLPLHGSISAGWGTANNTEDFEGGHYNTTINTLGGGVGFTPIKNLSLGANTSYTDNLEGALYSSLVSAGILPPQSLVQNSSSNSLSITEYVSYNIPAVHVYLQGNAQRQQQTLLGNTFTSQSYNGSANYSNMLLGGQFNGTVGLTRNSVSVSNQTTLGVNSSVNYTHQIQRWKVTGGFAYSQDTQTVLIAYTSSGYTYSGSVGRRLGRYSYWSASVGGGRSLLTDQPGTANSSQSYSTSISFRRFNINGTYSTSSGNALLTPTGLVASPVPLPVITPAALIIYDGRSYSGGISSTPIRGLTLTASYAKAFSETQSVLSGSTNSTENMNILLIYDFRKLNFTSGYSRVVQGFSLSGTPPTMVGSFYFGISRWFNFF